MVSNRFRSMVGGLPALSLLADAASFEKENEVEMILKGMESDVLAFRDEMQRLSGFRCDTATLTRCSKNNFNDCSSAYPDQQCMEVDELVISACGDGESCNALWDKTQTAVRIPANLARGSLQNPTDPKVIESVCYSRLAEQYMVDHFNYGNQMYFGSSTGSFRIIPARHSEECGRYDPRRRPWFVAASSGPKDVVVVIDVSGSMEDFGRINLAQEAAITIVDTLTVADRFAIIPFSDQASQIGGEGGLMRATIENKKRMIEAIKDLEANGATNFYDAFETAFDAIDETIREEATSGCGVAVLFMTDGKISNGPGADDVVDLVNERTNKISTNNYRKTTIFTFSLGEQADHDVMKSIACSTNGIWTPVDDFDDDLVTAMSSYYKLYALGLGEGGNEDWVAWVEPYEFHTAGKMGTSASAPVYDRSVNPPQFLGVATVDMYMDDLEEILGEDASSSTMLDRFVLLSTARCPSIDLTECEIDALRFIGGGDEATCGACNSTGTGYAGIVPEKCPFQSDLPNNCWHNTDMQGREYEDRACCKIGGVDPSDVCPVMINVAPSSIEGGTNHAIIGIVAAVMIAIVCSICVWKRKAIRAHMKQKSDLHTDGQPVPETRIDESVSIVLPPGVASASAPPTPNNPVFNVTK